MDDGYPYAKEDVDFHYQPLHEYKHKHKVQIDARGRRGAVIFPIIVDLRLMKNDAWFSSTHSIFIFHFAVGGLGNYCPYTTILITFIILKDMPN